MRRRTCGFMLLAIGLAPAACRPLVDPMGLGQGAARVVLLDVEDLRPPGVLSSDVYEPVNRLVLPDGSEVLGFYLTITTAQPDALLIDIRRDEAAEPLRLTSAGDLDGVPVEAVVSEPGLAAVRESLARDEGVFWRMSAGDDWGTPAYRVAVMLPAGWLENTLRLRLLTESINPGEPPIPGESIELARGFYHMAVLGDSVAWNNGTLDRDKYGTLVARAIGRLLKLKVVLQMHAISGATLYPYEGDVVCPVRCNGEVQSARTAIIDQIDLIEKPEAVDLVLINGCLNEIGLTSVLDPEGDDEELLELTDNFCSTEMANVLARLADACPNATIVVTGYYPMVGPTSDLSRLAAFLDVLGLPGLINTERLVPEVAARAALFDDASATALAEAVATVNGTLDVPRLLFVDPSFTPEHAVLTDDPWLWGLRAPRETVELLGVELDLVAEDPMARLRLVSCGQENVLADAFFCFYVAVGHPNVIGSRVFAERILSALQTAGWLPQTPEPLIDPAP